MLGEGDSDEIEFPVETPAAAMYGVICVLRPFSCMEDDVCGYGPNAGLGIGVAVVPVEEEVKLYCRSTPVPVGSIMIGEGCDIRSRASRSACRLTGMVEVSILLRSALLGLLSLAACSEVLLASFNSRTQFSRYRTYSMLACRIASLCISCPSQAGTMSFKVPNSSFILERRRRSIRLCAVLRAILRPATLVELGVFRFALELEGGVVGAVLDAGILVLTVFVCSAELLGFM